MSHNDSFVGSAHIRRTDGMEDGWSQAARCNTNDSLEKTDNALHATTESDSRQPPTLEPGEASPLYMFSSCPNLKELAAEAIMRKLASAMACHPDYFINTICAADFEIFLARYMQRHGDADGLLNFISKRQRRYDQVRELVLQCRSSDRSRHTQLAELIRNKLVMLYLFKHNADDKGDLDALYDEKELLEQRLISWDTIVKDEPSEEP